MGLEQEGWKEEGMDLRFFLLRFINSVWVLFVAALGGAAICAGGYLLYKQLYPAAKEYRAETKYYIDFAEDSTGIGYGYYNDFTWNDWMKSDDILPYTMSLLPETIGKDTVENAVKADIISDVRLLTITVTAFGKETADEIAQATSKSLIHFPEEIKEIDAIRVIREEEAKEVLVSDLTKNWGIFGLVFGAAASFFLWWLVLCMDFSVYLPKDVENRFGIPVLGVLYKGEGYAEGSENGKGDAEGRHGRKEFSDNAGYLLKGKEKISVVMICGGQKKELKKSELQESLILESLGRTIGKQGRVSFEGSFGNTDYAHMREADARILCFAYGGKDGKLAERYLSDLEKQDCRINYALIYDADKAMYRRYYWGKREKDS